MNVFDFARENGVTYEEEIPRFLQKPVGKHRNEIGFRSKEKELLAMEMFEFSLRDKGKYEEIDIEPDYAIWEAFYER